MSRVTFLWLSSAAAPGAVNAIDEFGRRVCGSVGRLVPPEVPMIGGYLQLCDAVGLADELVEIVTVGELLDCDAGDFSALGRWIGDEQAYAVALRYRMSAPKRSCQLRRTPT